MRLQLFRIFAFWVDCARSDLGAWFAERETVS